MKLSGNTGFFLRTDLRTFAARNFEKEKERNYGTIGERIVSIRITLWMRYDVLLLVTLIELCTFSSHIGKFPRALADVFRA